MRASEQRGAMAISIAKCTNNQVPNMEIKHVEEVLAKAALLQQKGASSSSLSSVSLMPIPSLSRHSENTSQQGKAKAFLSGRNKAGRAGSGPLRNEPTKFHAGKPLSVVGGLCKGSSETAQHTIIREPPPDRNRSGHRAGLPTESLQVVTTETTERVITPGLIPLDTLEIIRRHRMVYQSQRSLLGDLDLRPLCTNRVKRLEQAANVNIGKQMAAKEASAVLSPDVLQGLQKQGFNSLRDAALRQGLYPEDFASASKLFELGLDLLLHQARSVALQDIMLIIAWMESGPEELPDRCMLQAIRALYCCLSAELCPTLPSLVVDAD